MSIFKLNIQGIESVVNRLEGDKERILQGVDDELDASAEMIAGNAKADAPKDMGDLVGNINVEKQRFQKDIVCNVFYAPYVEFGTKNKVVIPNGVEEYAAQFKSEGINNGKSLWQAIKEWAARKGIDSKAVWFIYREVRDNGINPHPFMFNNYEAEKPNLVENIKKILKNG